MVTYGQKWQQTYQISGDNLDYLEIVAEPEGFLVQKGKLLMILASNAHYCDLTALVFVKQLNKGYNSRL